MKPSVSVQSRQRKGTICRTTSKTRNTSAPKARKPRKKKMSRTKSISITIDWKVSAPCAPGWPGASSHRSGMCEERCASSSAYASAADALAGMPSGNACARLIVLTLMAKRMFARSWAALYTRLVSRCVSER